MADLSVKQAHSPTERAQLYAAFPGVAAADWEAVLKVLPPSREVLVPGGKSYPVVTLVSTAAEEMLLGGLPVHIPGRVYFAEPAVGAEQLLTTRQRVLLPSIYLRHHNGYVRQRRLEQLYSAFSTVCRCPPAGSATTGLPSSRNK